MSVLFEEIDYRPTPIGPISLRRRRILSLDTDIYEIILGDEHLMSSLFTASEVALGTIGLETVKNSFSADTKLDVIVGGLGLGYTAQAALEHEQVRSLTVIELLDAVIDWHQDNLIPLDPPLRDDPRCTLSQGDFFALAASKEGFEETTPGRQYHAILIDIDHTPDWLLDERSGHFYSDTGLQQLRNHLTPKGVMGLWSDAEPDQNFLTRLQNAFDTAKAEPVTFHNPLQNTNFTQTVYIAQKAG